MGPPFLAVGAGARGDLRRPDLDGSVQIVRHDLSGHASAGSEVPPSTVPGQSMSRARVAVQRAASISFNLAAPIRPPTISLPSAPIIEGNSQ